MKKTWKRRGHLRGALTLETLVLMPVLIFQLAVSYWAWQMYDAKIDTMKAARGPVFSEAVFGCAARLPPVQASQPLQPGPVDAPLDGAEGVDLGVIGRKLPQAPGADVLERVIESRTAHLVRPFISNGYVGLPTARLGAQASMMCNESVRDGDPKAMKALSASSFDPRFP
jgi:hypothetical protein